MHPKVQVRESERRQVLTTVCHFHELNVPLKHALLQGKTPWRFTIIDIEQDIDISIW